MDEKKRECSCIDCGVVNCNHGTKSFPDFCLTTNMDPDVLKEAMDLYQDPENNKVACMSAKVEAEHYCQMTRVEEIAQFAKEMGYKKLGIATCAGLIAEARTAARIFRAHGLEVYGAACKVGTQRKTSIGIDPKCEEIGVNMCNPILQAKLLNAAKTDFNVVIGLCVGHDSLFYKYSDALCTTLVTKDRVLGHNPVAALYQTGSYYKRLLEEE
jgi:uncharacterized metal-binding protein